MTDMLLRDIPDEMHETIARLAAENGNTPEQEARAILHDALFRTRLTRILEEDGLGSALQAIGREYDVTTEFDGLRAPPERHAPTFE